MGSKNRVILNISDDVLFELIQEKTSQKKEGKSETEESKEKISRSKFIVDILTRALKDEIDERKAAFGKQFSVLPESDATSVHPLNHTIDSVHYINEQGFIRLDRVEDCYSMDHELFFTMMNTSVHTLISRAKSSVSTILPALIRNYWQSNPPVGNYANIINLVFINRVELTFKNFHEGRVKINIRAWFNVSRFPLNAIEKDNNFLHLDFLNIRYFRFKDIAVYGRMEKKHDRWLYLKPHTETRLGGFFVGLLYVAKNKESLIEEITNLSLPEGAKGMVEIPGLFVKLHYHSDQIKVDRRSFNKGFELINAQREQVAQSKPVGF